MSKKIKGDNKITGQPLSASPMPHLGFQRPVKTDELSDTLLRNRVEVDKPLDLSKVALNLS